MIRMVHFGDGERVDGEGVDKSAGGNRRKEKRGNCGQYVR